MFSLQPYEEDQCFHLFRHVAQEYPHFFFHTHKGVYRLTNFWDLNYLSM